MTQPGLDPVLKNHLIHLKGEIESLQPFSIYGTVIGLQGLIVKVEFKNNFAKVGSLCAIYTQEKEKDHPLMGEVVGFSNTCVLVMPYESLLGISAGNRVVFYPYAMRVFPCMDWKGRTLNALGHPIDDKGPLTFGEKGYALHAKPLMSSKRVRIKERLDVGIRAINTFLTCCKGQRMGIFAGSGVGKSMLLSMFTKYTQCDICIIGLVGERGREVKEFIEETLGDHGLKKSILVIATSDESPLMRRQAAYLTLTLAEYYRDLGLSVLCLIDSITRFAMAQREIGLSAGEPPTTKGYPPSVFTELPKLLERAGPGMAQSNSGDQQDIAGYITGLFTVLVEGDDTNEPISDTVRGILDGHIILDRSIAEKGQFPAIHILRSISRTVPGCHSEAEQKIVSRARKILAVYDNMEDMIRLGAYKFGSSPEVDEAISIMPQLLNFLKQKGNESTPLQDSFDTLKQVIEESIYENKS